MFRSLAATIRTLLRSSPQQRINQHPNIITANLSYGLSSCDIIQHYETYFDRHDIDGWDIRQGMNELIGMDLVPDPKIIESALLACRRVNDIALAIRWLEACKDSCGNEVDVIYPYIMQEIRPIMNDLGIPTLEDLGYNKPELALKSVYEL